MTTRGDGAAEAPLFATRDRDFLAEFFYETSEFPGGTFSAQVRLYDNAPGDPLLTLTPTAVVEGDNTILQFTAPKEDFEADDLPQPNACGGDTKLAYDVKHVAADGHTRTKFFGEFTIYGRVTS